MIRKGWIVAGVAVLLVGSAFSLAVARMGGMGRGHMGFMQERAITALEVRLKLTPDQSKQLRGLVSSKRDMLRDQFEAGKADRRALVEEIFKDNPSQAEIQKRISAIQERHTAMINQAVQAGLDFNKSLTPEQRAEMNKILQERFETSDRMHQKMQERMRDHKGHEPGAAPQQEEQEQ